MSGTDSKIFQKILQAMGTPKPRCRICIWQQRWYALGVGRVHHAQDELNHHAVELQASAQQILIQEPSVRTGLGSHQFLQRDGHKSIRSRAISESIQSECGNKKPFDEAVQ